MRSAMRAASQLSGRGPIDVDVAPVLARYNPIIIYDDMMLVKGKRNNHNLNTDSSSRSQPRNITILEQIIIELLITLKYIYST